MHTVYVKSESFWTGRTTQRLARQKGDVTVKVAPASDETRGPVAKDLSSLWKASDAHAVIQNGALIQLQQGEIIPAGKSLLQLDF